MSDLDLKDKDATRCSKKIISFIKHDNKLVFQEADKYFQKIIQDRISDNEAKHELYFSLGEFYADKNQFDLALQMLRGATASISPYEFGYLPKLRNCFDKLGQILRLSVKNETERSIEYIYHITSACLFEIASEINYSLMDNLRFYFEYREDNFSENIYLNDEDGYYDSALKSLGLLETKLEIIADIHRFATYDIPKNMGFSEQLLAGDNKASRKEDYKEFNNVPMILDFVKTIYAKTGNV